MAVIRFLLASLLASVLLGPTAPVGAHRGPAPTSGYENPADTLHPVIDEELGRRLDAIVSAAEAVGFSGQVLVAVAGRPVLHRAYGFADAREGRPMELDTPVGVASISKQFTAATVLELEARGLVSLEDSLPAFFEHVPQDKRSITLRHLITHTSGLRSSYSEDFEPASRDLLVRGILHRSPAFPPDARWEYSAAGYNLLALVVEEVTGLAYEEAVRRMVIEPAAMEATGFLSLLPETETEVAHSYQGWDDRGSPREWPRNLRNLGAGDMVSTAWDLWTWDRALEERRVLSEAARERFYGSLRRIGDDTSYGFGLFIHHPPEGPLVIEHGGDAELGFNGSFLRYREEGFVIIITCNARTPEGQSLRHAIGEDLETLLRGGEPDTSAPARRPSASEIRRLAGTYRLAGEGELHVLTDGAHLWIAAADPEGANLLSGVGPERAADFRRGESRTRSLLSELLSGDSTAYHRALTEEGMPFFADYWAEWRALIESRGPLRGFRIVGSHGRGSDVATRARLSFGRGSVMATYFWRDGAHGRLGGTFVGGPEFWPVATLGIAVPLDGDGRSGTFTARHPFRARTVELRVPEDQLVEPTDLLLIVDGREIRARRIGVAGWLPAGR